MSEPIRTTVYLDAADYQRLKLLARAQGRSTAELIREAVASYAGAQRPPRLPGSIASGRSGRGDVAARAEELLDGFGQKTSRSAKRRR
jgi:hypothetical protein